MMVFWIVAALLLVAALLFLVPPLVQKVQGKDVLARDELNATIFKDQLAELERDLSAGIVTKEQYDIARHDLERSFLQEAESGEEKEQSQTDRVVGRAAAVVIALLIPIFAVVLYGKLGAGESGLHPEDAKPQLQAEGHDGTLEQQVRKLQDHLQANPDDAEGWVMLGRSYYFLKQYGPASESFGRASSLQQDSSAELLADYADALAMANGRNMAGRPYELVKRALAIEPENQKALWLGGTASYQAQDFETTLDYWKRLLQLFPEGSENYVQMQRNIVEIQQRLGMPVDAETVASAAQGDGAGQASISGVVRLDETLALEASIDDTLFVFARAASGPRMPLAILRKTVKDLPFTFTLNDAMAMNPAMKLSNFQQVVIGARISKSGNAMPQPGDLKGSFGPVNVNAPGNVELIIDDVVR
ncbi:MAG: c-type cytochrome biogenesis protein CcmI [Gammaproteobacteria bacterium]|nr:c-type cytochrome biogenesis protein CcmI [Gammaproteobacteria bacterium]